MTIRSKNKSFCQCPSPIACKRSPDISSSYFAKTQVLVLPIDARMGRFFDVVFAIKMMFNAHVFAILEKKARNEEWQIEKFIKN